MRTSLEAGGVGPMNTHGGKREGAGRPPILEGVVRVLVAFERRQVDALDRYQAERRLPGRVATIRSIVDLFLKDSERY